MGENTLYVVATPIGNLEDITLRALRVLREVECIYAEDTRVARRLLAKYDIETPVTRLDAHTENKNTHLVIELLSSGENVAYVSDAGTPGISDPGARLVAAVRDAGHCVVAVPGPSALTVALSIAGISDTAFTFLGFLPHKKGRQTLLKEIAETSRTVVLYESTHRIMKLLSELDEYVQNRHICVARELTKIHEEVLRGSASEVRLILEANPQKQKGEFVVIVAPVGK